MQDDKQLLRLVKMMSWQLTIVILCLCTTLLGGFYIFAWLWDSYEHVKVEQEGGGNSAVIGNNNHINEVTDDESDGYGTQP